MDMAEVLFRAKLTRVESSTPWGFRLQGGVEFDKPLTLLKVVEESVASKGGLHPGDIVVKLAGKSGCEMTHKDAQEAIISAGNNLEIIVERADVTIVTPTPPTTACDVTPTTTSASTNVAATSETDNIVPTETQQTAAEKSPERTSINNYNGELSQSSELDKDRSKISDNSAVSCDIVKGNSVISPSGTEPSTSGAEAGAKQTVNDTDSPESNTNKSKPKVLENDKIAKDSPHIKPSEPSKSQEKQLKNLSTSKHKPVDTTRTQENTVTDKSDIVVGGESATDVVLVSVPDQDCDTEISQQTSDILPESAVGQKSVDDECISKDQSLNLTHVDSEALSSRGDSQHDSKPELETDLNLNSIKLSSVTESEQVQVTAENKKTVFEVESEQNSNISSPSQTKNHVSTDISTSLIQENINSKSPSNPVCANNSTTDPCVACEPFVIKEFQSPDVAVEPVETTATTIMAPLSQAPSSMDSMPTQAAPTTASNSQPLSSHIPISSPTAATVSLTMATPNEQSSTVKTDDIARMIIESPQTSETNLVPCQQLTVTSAAPASSQTGKVQNNDTRKESTTIVSKAEPVSSHVGISVPIQIPQQSREGVSRQTNAPAEEIMIAPKPSVQIMTSAEHKETIQILTGDKRIEEVSDSESVPSGKDISGSIVSHEMKDFSKTAPWRMHKQTGSPSTELGSSPTTSEQSVLHPWRKSRSEHPMSHSLDDRQLSAAADRMSEVSTSIIKPSQSIAYGGNSATITISTSANEVASRIVQSEKAPMPKLQSTLTYVGKRIESPVSSPVGVGAPFFKVLPAAPVSAGRDVQPSERSNTIPLSHTTLPSTTDPISMLIPSPTRDFHSPQPEEIHSQAAAPDLVDIPMPAVKEMVENLNKRLEAIAVQHPKIVEPSDVSELGLNFFKHAHPDLSGYPLEQIYQDFGEQEIIIDTPPNPNFTGTSLEQIKQRLCGTQPGYYQVYELVEPGSSPGSHRRRFSLPGGSLSYNRHNQRRVRFAEPPESSVIEIEPRKQRMLERRRLWEDDDGTMSDMEDYTSASLLAATLDRIEREDALSTASLQRHRNAKQRAQSVSGDISQAKPTETFRDKVISFESLGETKQDVLLSSLKPHKEKFVLGPGRSGSRGFSFSIGQAKPGSFSLSLTHQRGSGQPPTQVALSVPPTEGHFTYTISPRTGSGTVQYSMPTQGFTESIVKTVSSEHVKAHSLDSARTVHIQYPPKEGVPTIQTQLLSTAGPLSPQQQVMRQLAGRPGIRSPTNYSNTLQIDTSSRLQHRSPSPPNPSYPPNIQSDRSHLSPQRLIHPQARFPDTGAAEYQAQRSSSPSQGAPIGIKVRQPSPTNPMAYQRSTSPQGVPQYGPMHGGHQQQAARQLSMPVVQQQTSTGPHGGMAHQPPSPRAVSPVSFQHQSMLQTGSSPVHPRPVSPHAGASLMVPPTGPYPQSPSPVSPTPQARMTIRAPQLPQHILHSPGYPKQQSPYQQPSPRLSQPRQLQHPMGLNPGQPMPRGSLQRMPQPMPFTRDVPIAGVPPGPGGAVARPSISTPPPGVPYTGAPTSGPGAAGLFALFDKRFTEKFLQWSDERPGDLCRSETYKLVHEMDEESDDL